MLDLITTGDEEEVNLCNIKVHDIRYNVSRVTRMDASLSLIDRGANGGIAGDNVRVLSVSDHRVDVSGVGNHKLTDLKIVSAGGVMSTHKGDVVAILHQYALIPGSMTIHSSLQLEAFRQNVDDRSHKLGGSQSITTVEGYVVPLNICNGFAVCEDASVHRCRMG